MTGVLQLRVTAGHRTATNHTTLMTNTADTHKDRCMRRGTCTRQMARPQMPTRPPAEAAAQRSASTASGAGAGGEAAGTLPLRPGSAM